MSNRIFDLSDELMTRIEEYRFHERHRSNVSAVRELLETALNAWETKGKKKAKPS